MKHCLVMALAGFCLLRIGGCSPSAEERMKLKEELKQEILAELRGQEQTTAQASLQEQREEMKKEIEQEVMAKVQSRIQTTISQAPDVNSGAVQWQRVPVGSAEGRIVFKGEGLEACKVKLVRILKPQSVIEMFNVVREGAEFTAVTDKKGKYHFDRLPVGGYKLKWQLPGDQGWIRRLKDKPDAIIKEGQATVLDPVETNRKLVAH